MERQKRRDLEKMETEMEVPVVDIWANRSCKRQGRGLPIACEGNMAIAVF